MAMFASVILEICSVSYSIPREVKEVTQSKLFSLQNLRSVSLMGPILMTFVLL